MKLSLYMARPFFSSCVLVVLCALLSACAPGLGLRQPEVHSEPGQVPFEPNLGQISSPVKFLSRSDAFTTYLSGMDAEAVMSFRNAPGTDPQFFSVLPVTKNTTFAEPVLQFTGRGVYRSKVDVQQPIEQPLFNGILYRDVFPGVDITYISQSDRLRYELHLHPGAKLETLAFEFPGLKDVQIDADGNLVGRIGKTQVVQGALHGVQRIEGKEIAVPIEYRVRSGRYVELVSEDYDNSVALLLVPQVTTR